jgi:hypothetical protein
VLRGRGAIALALIALGALGLAGIVACNESVEGWLADRCERAGTETDPNGNRAEAFHCAARASTVAADLGEAHEPADRRSTPEGHFLRYADDMVGIVPAEGGGSTAYLSDERGGYGFFFPFVGGWWGTYSGPGESFRGGGPGGGK